MLSPSINSESSQSQNIYFNNQRLQQNGSTGNGGNGNGGSGGLGNGSGLKMELIEGNSSSGSHFNSIKLEIPPLLQVCCIFFFRLCLIYFNDGINCYQFLFLFWCDDDDDIVRSILFLFFFIWITICGITIAHERL